MSTIVAFDLGGTNSSCIAGKAYKAPGHTQETLDVIDAVTWPEIGNLQKIGSAGISALIEKFLKHLQIDPKDIERGLFACAGNDHPSHAKILREAVVNAGIRDSAEIHPVNDVYFLAMAAAAINPKQYGHLISGTGACFLLAGNGEQVRVGGTWYLFEDAECGAYGIGRKLFLYALRDIQLAQSLYPNCSDTELVIKSSSEILNSVAAYISSKESNEPLDVILSTYAAVYSEGEQSNTKRVNFTADAAPIALELAMKGDRRCKNLLTQVGKNIYEAIQDAIEATHFHDGALILSGAVFEKNRIVLEQFKHSLNGDHVFPQFVTYESQRERQEAALRGFQLSNS